MKSKPMGVSDKHADPANQCRLGVAVLLLLALLLAQCILTVYAKSVTFDEPAYVAAGYLYLTRGAFEVDAEHPPLFKYLLALPLLSLPLLPPEQVPNWNSGTPQQFIYGASFLFQNSVDAETILFSSRLVVVGVSLVLGLLVWRWAKHLYGPEAGIVALLMYCFCPNVIAHSSLATLDIGVSAGVTAALYSLWRLYRRPSLGAAVIAGLALGVALLVKCSAVILLPLVPFLAAASLLRGRGVRAHGGSPPGASYGATHEARRRNPVPGAPFVVGLTLVVLVVAAIVVHLGWGPGKAGLPRYAAAVNLVAFRRHVLTDQAYERFCWGRYSAKGFPWYFFAAFVLKTPLPSLLLVVTALVARIARRMRPTFDELFLMVPALAVLFSTVVVRENIGLRYILPVYPLVFVMIGGFVAERMTWWGRAEGRWKRVGVAGMGVALLAWYIGGSLRIAPHYLAFFNELAGGPANGIRYLDDSNIDWGQDLKTLSRYLHEHEIEEITLLYTPTYLADLAVPYYGIRARGMSVQEIRDPREDWYAVSAHALQRPVVATGPGGERIRFDWLDRFEPIARVGYSIYVYRFD